MRMSATLAMGVLAALPCAALAQSAGVLGFTGGSQFSSFNSDGDTVGWYFTVHEPIVVTDLGFWDSSQDGLAGEHEVAIWDATTQAMLAHTVVQSGTTSPLIGQWRYESITNLMLAPGDYVIGAYYHPSGGPIDNYTAVVSSVDTSPEITLTASAVDANPAGGGPYPLTFPATKGGANGRFGPNFLFVPAPGALGVLALGGLVATRRRR